MGEVKATSVWVLFLLLFFFWWCVCVGRGGRFFLSASRVHTFEERSSPTRSVTGNDLSRVLPHFLLAGGNPVFLLADSLAIYHHVPHGLFLYLFFYLFFSGLLLNQVTETTSSFLLDKIIAL